MANEKNLIPAQKGEVRNPKGKPKGCRNRATIFKELLAQVAEGGKGTNADAVAAALLSRALKGDVAAIREILDSAYGKITEKVESTHSFTKMGDIVAVPAGVSIADSRTKGTALEFDIGENPDAPLGIIDDSED
jgi:hypothetical protein